MKKTITKAYNLLLQSGNFEKIQFQQSSDRLCIISPAQFMNQRDIELILSAAKLFNLLVILTSDDEFKFKLSLVSY